MKSWSPRSDVALVLHAESRADASTLLPGSRLPRFQILFLRDVAIGALRTAAWRRNEDVIRMLSKCTSVRLLNGPLTCSEKGEDPRIRPSVYRW